MGRGGLSQIQAEGLRDVERENARLRRAVYDLKLDEVILQGGRLGTCKLLSQRLAISES
jgi:hypothetical protein